VSKVASDPTLERDSASLVLEVPDMDCASCAQRISERLEKLEGVENVDARVVAKDVRIAFDPDLLDEGAIEAAVRSLGYTVERDGMQSRREAPRRKSVWRSRDASRSYASGIALATGLALRFSGLDAAIWTGFTWTLSVPSILYVAAALVGGLNFFPKGLRAARDLRLDMNFLMTIAIFGALGIGEFFEAGTIAFLFGIAELLERYAVDRARGSIEKLLDLAPATARVHRDGDVVTIPVEDVVLGEIVQIRPGEKVPVDGWVRDGVSAVDQSPITGESMPVTKQPSDYVYAGSMNQEGYLEVEAAKRAGDTTLAHIIHLVEEAEASRSPSPFWR
jgi:Cd2+/Zn2+-exporting ATPase